MLAYDFPVLGAFLVMLWFFLWVLWLFLLFRTIIDIFRSEDLGGVAKVLWLILLLMLPYLGVFIYVIVRGTGMSRRDAERQRAAEESLRTYIREAAGSDGASASTSRADELAKLADLRDRGVIDEDEFAAEKSKILS